MNMKKKEKYLCNGKTFNSHTEVVKYCEENGWRVASTETIRRGVYLITVNAA